MPQCVVITGGAVVESAADPCTGFVLLTPAEYGALAANPFYLTPAQGALIGAAIGAVWVTAWAWRTLARLVQSDGVPSERES